MVVVRQLPPQNDGAGAALTPAAVAWYHRNRRDRSDIFHTTLRQQGLAGCGPSCWDMLTNRSFGAVLLGDAAFGAVNATAIGTDRATSASVELAIAVTSAQTDTEQAFVARLEARYATVGFLLLLLLLLLLFGLLETR